MLGASPGPKFLMSLAVEHEDASELVDLYCGEIVHALRQQPPLLTNIYEPETIR